MAPTLAQTPVTDPGAPRPDSRDADDWRTLSARYLLDRGVPVAEAFKAAGGCPECRLVAEAMSMLEASR